MKRQKESTPQLAPTIQLNEPVVPYHLLYGRHVSACRRHWKGSNKDIEKDRAALHANIALHPTHFCTTRPTVPGHHHQRIPGEGAPSVVWLPQMLLRRGWENISWHSRNSDCVPKGGGPEISRCGWFPRRRVRHFWRKQHLLWFILLFLEGWGTAPDGWVQIIRVGPKRGAFQQTFIQHRTKSVRSQVGGGGALVV